jgi:hypothetical protein
MKIILRLLLALFVLSNNPIYSQEDMFRKDRKRTSRKWKKSNQSYNPYLDKKAKNKPSAIMMRGDKKELRRQKRAAKKQMRHSKRHVNRKHR